MHVNSDDDINCIENFWLENRKQCCLLRRDLVKILTKNNNSEDYLLGTK